MINRTEETFIRPLAEFLKTKPTESKLKKWLKSYSREWMLYNPMTSVDLALLAVNLNATIIAQEKCITDLKNEISELETQIKEKQ
jgi:hypothetical protein